MNHLSKSKGASLKGFSLIELMVALVIGLFITGAVIAGYTATKQAYNRQEQIADMQQNARAAFEYINEDSRMAGHLGCFSGNDTSATVFTNSLASANSLPYAFAVALEGYNASGSTSVSNTPTYSTTASNWNTNTATNQSPASVTVVTNTIPINTVHSAGLNVTSDVLVIRTTDGNPVRLTGATSATTINFEASAGDTCPAGGTRQSGFCANTIGVVADCTRATVFQATGVTVPANGAIVHVATSTAGPGNDASKVSWPTAYQASASSPAELLKLQTVMYFVAQGANGPALFRKVFDGETTSPVAQELIDNVDAMKVLYGRDTSSPADGTIDEYVSARQVTDWNAVLAIRVGLMLRSSTVLSAGAKVPSTVVLNGTSFTVPSTGSGLYERRAFVTTIALRNRIKYF